MSDAFYQTFFSFDCFLFNFFLHKHSYPKWETKIKNVLVNRSMVMSQEWSPEFKMLFWKILGLGLSELALQSSLKKHLREKLKKVDPHYFRGGLPELQRRLKMDRIRRRRIFGF